MDLKQLCQQYFKVWNSHDAEGLKALFDDNVRLRDWDVEVKGCGAVAEANGKIFQAVPNIEIEVLKMHAASESVCCEILVHLHNEENLSLKVVDVIEFQDGKIKAARAYKG